MDLGASEPTNRRLDDDRTLAGWSADGLDPRSASGGGAVTALRALPIGKGRVAGAPRAHADRPIPGEWPHNLPHPLTSFIGREQEIAEAQRLLTASRLVTLTGAGGVGKTRLGHAAAASQLAAFRDGVWLVQLAALADGALVPQAVAGVLGVREEAERSLTATLADALRTDHLLLVLDNCEHLIEACAALTDSLLRACPALWILATSRQALGIAGETTFRVPSLSLCALPAAPTVPSSSEDENHEPVGDSSLAPGQTDFSAAAPEAVRLFVERARAAVPAFALRDRNVSAVEQICRQLDGIPLAIELAAVRIAVLSPDQIAARLDDRFSLLTGGSRTALPRHQTLLALVDWSYDLLDEKERVLLRRLAVFAGGWTLDAAESVCAGEGLAPNEILDLLSGLVTKSLVQTGGHTEEVRYRFLESLRAYAIEKLRDAGEEVMLHQRHFEWCLTLAECAEPELVGPQQVMWLERLDEEHENLRTALRWSVEDGNTGGGLRLGGALYRFWETRGFVSEGHRWLIELLARSDAAPLSASEARSRARALQAAGRLAVNAGDYGDAQHLLDEAVATARAHDDRPGLAAGAFGLGYLARMRGDYAATRAFLEGALELFQEQGDMQGVADSLVSLGVVAHFQDDLAAAQSLYETGLSTYRALGNRQGVAISLNDLGEVALERGDLATARRLEEESLVLANEIGDRERVAYALAALGGVAALQGESRRALRLAATAASIRESIGETVSDAWWDRFERWMEPARRTLSADEMAAIHDDGLAIPAGEVVDFALTPAGSIESTTARLVPPSDGGPRSALTKREREVAELIARGLTNRQIAAELVITEGTAANHVKHILARLGVDSRVQIAAWAIECGLHLSSPT
jgi:predicted ATPase/DNA-binding CsgD family transcriptional regulator